MRFKRFATPLSHILRGAPQNPPDPAHPLATLDSASSEALVAAALGAGEDGQRGAAQERVAQLIDAGTVDFARLCAPGANLSALLAVAGHCRDPDHLTRALALVDQPSRMARLVTEGSSSRVRRLAAQSISDPAELKALLRQLRGKDKSVYRIIKQKCEVLRAEERRLVQIQNDAVAACESLERHAHRVHEVIYEPSFRHFHSRWEALEPQAPPELRQRAARAVERCREIIAEHLRELARQAARESQQAARQAARELAELESQRRAEADSLAAAEAAARREAEGRLRAEKAAAEAQALRRVGGLIGQAHGALREGNTGRASGLRRSVEEKLSVIAAVPPPLAKQVQQLDAKLNELRQWKEHAAAPKRAELIAEMEALVGSSEEPEALADRIRQLQQDWKTVSKGIVIDSEADWQRFRQASTSAYQPCREYFEARAKLRAANAEKRREVLDRLRAFETAQSGDRPDGRTTAVVLREAPLEWRRHSPVDRAAGRALQEEFDAAMGRLQGRLDAWQAQNAADKQSLVRQAQQLGAQQDGRETEDAVRRLQTRWNEVGPARRDQEQALWAEFRAQCDAIHQKRQQAQAHYAAGLGANKARAVALCEEIEHAAGLPGAELPQWAAKIPQWRSAFEAVGEMPRADARALAQRFERALGRIRAALSQRRLHEKDQAIADLLEAGRHIQAYGWAVSQGSACSECDALKQAAESFIAGVRQWPKGGAEALRQALAEAATAADLDAAVHESALRMLCIRSELLADRATPPEDQALRRSHQMQRLVERMGGGGEAHPDDVEALALEWVRVGPVPAPTHQRLLARFRPGH